MLTGRSHRALSKPRVYLLWMFFFLAAIGFLASILYPQMKSAFWGNPSLNGVILCVLAFGVLFSFSRVSRLYPEIRWVNNFRVANPGASSQTPALLAPLATMLRDRTGALSLSATSLGAIMDSIGSRLDEARDTSRYMIGLLVFLGLLGTFWGLLVTIQSINDVIASLNVGSADTGSVIGELQKALRGPLDGMGLAFSSSLFGLAGSLILGFLDLQASQAQNRFYNELEEWLSGITQISADDVPVGDGSNNDIKFAILDMQRSMAELGDRIQYGLDAASGRSDEAAKELARGIDNLVKQMRAEQKVVREWVDEQASHTSDLNMVLRELTARLGGTSRRG